MSQAKAADDLKAVNDKLKEELERLKKLAGSVESKDEIKKRDQIVVETEEIRAAFNKFDLDKSGYIDAAELAKLAVALNKPLSKDELEKALKEIDTSGDQKISFPEFRRWWLKEEKSTFESLRDALRSGALHKAIPDLIQQLSLAEPGRQIHYDVDVTAGNFQPAANDVVVDLALAFQKAEEAAAIVKATEIQGALAALIIKFPVVDNTSEAAMKDLLAAFSKSKEVRLKFDVIDKKTYGVFYVGIPEDPTAVMAKAGFKLEEFLKSANLHVRLGYTLEKVFDADTVVADFVRGRATFKFDASRALFETFAKVMRAPQLVIFNIITKFELSLQQGDLKTLALSARELNDYLEQVMQQQAQMFQQQGQAIGQGEEAGENGGGNLPENFNQQQVVFGADQQAFPQRMPIQINVDRTLENKLLAKNSIPGKWRKGAALQSKRPEATAFLNFWKKYSTGLSSFELVLSSGLHFTAKFENLDLVKYAPDA